MAQRNKRKSVLPARFQAGHLESNPPLQKKRCDTNSQSNGHVTQNQHANETPAPTCPKKQGDAKFVVGIDFGTTHSGFAYASMHDPGKIYSFEQWPSKGEAGALRYGKTQTSLRYVPGKSEGTFELQDWGWPAFVSHRRELEGKRCVNSLNNRKMPSVPPSSESLFFTDFKLHLADGANSNYKHSKQEDPPKGLSFERLIVDYLRELSTYILDHLKNKQGIFIRKKDVKWCLTVPSIWTNYAKHAMRVCSEKAGLVQGPQCQDEEASSKENFKIVWEPEAASVKCLQKLKDTHDLKMGSKVLVVDAGGGTVDLVVHELVDDSGLRVKEVTPSTGDVCGGTFLDKAFERYLAGKIGCFKQFNVEQPHSVLDILSKWQGFKFSFGKFGRQQDQILPLPAKLAKAWQAYDEKHARDVGNQFDEIVITEEEMKVIFDEQVNKILELMRGQVAQAKIEAVFVVGGFSNSPYLMKRIREEFSSLATTLITSPEEPESAVCQGAVIIGTHGGDIMTSRKSRKTYGVNYFRPFVEGDPLGSKVNADNGEVLCKDAFDVFTRIGDEVPVDHVVYRQYGPFSKSESSIVFTIFSTTDPNPLFVTDRGVVQEGCWTYPLPPQARKMKEDPSVAVNIFFGRTHIEVSANPLNFRTRGKKFVFSVSFDGSHSHNDAR